jgi:2-polyprenyl-3-methyl-5-hydroxy-6-metoxy-1,4-benzoquinol methylase
MKNYYIKEGYKSYSSEVNMTLDENREDEYWDTTRVLGSAFYQWDVYKYVASIAIKDNTVVDIGCGAGYKLYNIVGKIANNIIGIDQDNPIKYCKETYDKGAWLVENFEKPKINIERKIDIIINSDVIEHLIEPDSVLEYIKKLATESTIIVFSTPDRDRMRGCSCMESKKPEHIREWNFNEFKAYVNNSGFEIIEHFHQYPLKCTFNNLRTYIQIWKNKTFGGDGMNFKYNQVLVCRIKR